MGIGLGTDYVTWWEILKWIPPGIKTSCDTQNENSNPMGIGLGNSLCDMVGNPKMDPPHIKTSCGTQNGNFQSYGYRVRN